MLRILSYLHTSELLLCFLPDKREIFDTAHHPVVLHIFRVIDHQVLLALQTDWLKPAFIFVHKELSRHFESFPGKSLPIYIFEEIVSFDLVDVFMA